MSWKKTAKMIIILLGVYVTLRYLLPFLFPFLVAVLLVMAERKWERFAAHYLCLKHSIALLFFCTGVLGGMLFAIYRLILYLGQQGVRFLGFCKSSFLGWQSALSGIFGGVDRLLGLQDGTMYLVVSGRVSEWMRSFQNFLLEKLPDHVIQAGAACIGFFVILSFILMASLLFYQEYNEIMKDITKKSWYPVWQRVSVHMAAGGSRFLRAQGIIWLCVWVYNAVGLFLLGFSDTLLLGALIAVVDFLPVLGAGTILIPWSLFLLLMHKGWTALGVFILYLLSFFTRQYLEPRLIGNRSGIRPFYMLFCIYLGLRLFGIWGIFLGPFGATLVIGLYQEWTSC